MPPGKEARGIRVASRVRGTRCDSARRRVGRGVVRAGPGAQATASSGDNQADPDGAQDGDADDAKDDSEAVMRASDVSQVLLMPE